MQVNVYLAPPTYAVLERRVLTVGKRKSRTYSPSEYVTGLALAVTYGKHMSRHDAKTIERLVREIVNMQGLRY